MIFNGIFRSLKKTLNFYYLLKAKHGLDLHLSMAKEDTNSVGLLKGSLSSPANSGISSGGMMRVSDLNYGCLPSA
jgi:hypothetical protein